MFKKLLVVALLGLVGTANATTPNWNKLQGSSIVSQNSKAIEVDFNNQERHGDSRTIWVKYTYVNPLIMNNKQYNSVIMKQTFICGNTSVFTSYIAGQMDGRVVMSASDTNNSVIIPGSFADKIYDFVCVTGQL